MAETGADYEEIYASGFNGAESQDTKELTKGYAGVHSTGFRDFLLASALNRAIAECGFEHPSEVQHKCIPTAMLGGDILCQAKSGMGKTAVFVLTILQALHDTTETKSPSALVICHTRELAFQICKEFGRFTRYMPHIKAEAFYGGMKKSLDQEKLRQGVSIVVGTPGRVLDLIQDGSLVCDNINFFVLDECDHLLNSLKMRADVQEIFKKTPRNKQVMMFSATMSTEVKEVARKFLNDPTEIFVDPEKLTLHGLQQYYVQLDEKVKISKLMELLDTLEFNQVVIFTKNVSRAQALTKQLVAGKFPAIAIHSDMKQEERIRLYQEFKEFKHRILVSTDLCARGIDIERVNIVFNFDMPSEADTYLHRVGRAGRFGTKGLAVTFSSNPDDERVLKEIQERFVVSISPLPATINVSSYMNA